MKSNNNKKYLNIVLYVASVLAMIGLMILGGRILKEDNFGLMIEFSVITIVTLVFLYLISGKKTFSYMNNQTWYSIKHLLPTLIFPLVFMLLGVMSYFIDKPQLNPHWVKDLLLFTIDMFLVGIYEEGCYRACANDAMLPLFRKLKHPFLLTAFISSIIFGYVHVVSVDFSDLQQVLQFFLKIAAAGVTGMCYLIVYWKTRNLLGIAIVHCLNDWIPGFLSEIFVWKDAADTNTYTTGDAGTTILYAVQLAFMLLCLFGVWRRVGRKIDYQKTLEEW
ncbi:MAG: CPBP family intramembrane metalloprotease [Erysipelotrichaceae bacterium]|nr:CPBP family intramembrane metalloprotease [Erysipelotrichaceae bacterium]